MERKEFYDVDYESIKSRIKTFLSKQTPLKDYNFDGAAISMWINLIAYIVMYLNSILNFFGNELFIESARLEDNIYKSAYQLNYLPRRKSAPKITLEVMNNSASTILIPAYTSFVMESIKLITIKDQYVAGSSVTEIEAVEGSLVTFEYTFQGNDFETFILNDREEIDNNYFYLFVNGVRWKSVYEQQNFYLANNFFIRYFDNFEIRFDKADGFFNVPELGDNIVVKYVKTSGADYNGYTYDQNIRVEEPFLNSQHLQISTTDFLKDGLDEEEMESISNNAPLFFSGAGRCVTEDDFNNKIKDSSLYHNMADMVVYSSHKDIVTIVDEYPTELITTETKMDKGYFVFSGLRRNVDNDFNVDYTFMTIAEQNEIVEFFEPFKFIQIFGKYKIPNIVQVQPEISIKLLRNFDLDRLEFEANIEKFMETKIGFNSSFNISELVSFIKSFDFIDYTDVDYRSFVSFPKPFTIVDLSIGGPEKFNVGENIFSNLGGGKTATGKVVSIHPNLFKVVVERTSSNNFIPNAYFQSSTQTAWVAEVFNKVVIRLDQAINPSSVFGVLDSKEITDNGAGIIMIDGEAKGTVNYNTGYIEFENVFKFDTYNVGTIEFEFANDIAIRFNKETFLDHIKADVEYIA